MQTWATSSYYEDDDDDAPPPGFEHRKTHPYAHTATHQHHVHQVACWNHQEHIQQHHSWQQPQASTPAHDTASTYRSAGRLSHGNVHSQQHFLGPPAAGVPSSSMAGIGGGQFAQQPVPQQQQQHNGYISGQPSGWETGSRLGAPTAAGGVDAAASSRPVSFNGPPSDYGIYKADDDDYRVTGSPNIMARQQSNRHGRSSQHTSQSPGGSTRRAAGSSGYVARQARAPSLPAPHAAASPGSARTFRVTAEAGTPERSPPPDYGPYGNHDGSDDDYGQRNSSSSRRRAHSRRRPPAAGSDARQQQQQKQQKQKQKQQQQQQRKQPQASSLQAATAASQALVGINASSTPGSGSGSSSRAQQGVGGGRRSRGRRGAARKAAAGGGSSSTAAGSRHAELEAELAVLRAALAEAEERQVEAQMAVLTLETDKTTLESQLQGMRAQKQQLEMMLLFGDEPQPVAGGGGSMTPSFDDEGNQSDGDCSYQSDDEQDCSQSDAATEGAENPPGHQQDAAELKQFGAEDESNHCNDQTDVGSAGTLS